MQVRWGVSIGSFFLAGLLAGGSAAGVGGRQEVADKQAAPSVDVELVIAVDVSYSMDLDELAIQREGYGQAIVSKEFLQALRGGPNGKISITYFEWSASSDQRLIIPWRVIDGPETADAVASEIVQTPVRQGSRTSISGAIQYAMPLFDENPNRGFRRVIDISGDGPNNNGPTVTPARDEALAKGIVINGLPIMVNEPSYSSMDIENLTGTTRTASPVDPARLWWQSRIAKSSRKRSGPSSYSRWRARLPNIGCRRRLLSPVRNATPTFPSPPQTCRADEREIEEP